VLTDHLRGVGQALFGGNLARRFSEVTINRKSKENDDRENRPDKVSLTEQFLFSSPVSVDVHRAGNLTNKPQDRS